jgi:hypothetical protein
VCVCACVCVCVCGVCVHACVLVCMCMCLCACLVCKVQHTVPMCQRETTKCTTLIPNVSGVPNNKKQELYPSGSDVHSTRQSLFTACNEFVLHLDHSSFCVMATCICNVSQQSFPYLFPIRLLGAEAKDANASGGTI